MVEAKVDADERHQSDRYDGDLKPWRDRGYPHHKVFLTPGGEPKSGTVVDSLSFKTCWCFLAPLHKLRRRAGHDFFRLYMAGSSGTSWVCRRSVL